MGWREAGLAAENDPTRAPADDDLRDASGVAHLDPLAVVRHHQAAEDELGPATDVLVVKTYDASGERYRFGIRFSPALVDRPEVVTREALARLYVHPEWQDFDPQVSREDAQQAVRVAETKAWAAKCALMSRSGVEGEGRRGTEVLEGREVDYQEKA